MPALSPVNPRPEIVLPPGFALRIDYDPESVPASLLSGWDPGRYRGLEVLLYAEYGGCSATPVTMQVLDRQVPESPVCPSWRQLWPREVREKGADVVLAPAGLRFVLPTVVVGVAARERRHPISGTAGSVGAVRAGMTAASALLVFPLLS